MVDFTNASPSVKMVLSPVCAMLTNVASGSSLPLPSMFIEDKYARISPEEGFLLLNCIFVIVPVYVNVKFVPAVAVAVAEVLPLTNISKEPALLLYFADLIVIVGFVICAALAKFKVRTPAALDEPNFKPLLP